MSLFDDNEDDDIVSEEYFGNEIELGGYTRADEERDREYRIREQALGAAMELNGRHDNPVPYADMVIADAEKFAAFLRGTLVTSGE